MKTILINSVGAKAKILTPIKHTNSSLHTVLLGLLIEAGHVGVRPLQ